MIGNQRIGYEIAGMKLTVSTPWKEKVSDAFRPFVREFENADWEVVFSEIPKVEIPNGKMLYENSIFRVYEREEGVFERQYYNDRADRTAYVSVLTDAKQKKVFTNYLGEAKGKFGSGEAEFFCIAFEKILMEEQAMILHASCVDTPYGGLLFVGHSGAGKSTQAELWCQHGNGKLLNGDRPILKAGTEGFFAYGSPYAGSSGCHVNERCKIRAMFFVKQAETCQLRPLKGVEKFRKVFGNLTVNLWDPTFVAMAGNFAQKLAEEIPMYEFSCTKEQEAVETLELLLKI